jgi:hypothetical protein
MDRLALHLRDIVAIDFFAVRGCVLSETPRIELASGKGRRSRKNVEARELSRSMRFSRARFMSMFVMERFWQDVLIEQ